MPAALIVSLGKAVYMQIYEENIKCTIIIQDSNVETDIYSKGS